MYVSKWHTFTASTMLQLCAGLCYCFSIYSASLKTELQLSQTQLEGLGTALLSGGYLAWIPGLVYDSLSHRHKLGPRLVTGIGVLMQSAGYLAIWLTATHRITLQYWQLLLLSGIAANGVVWLDTAAIITNVRNFPDERGTVVGAMKSFLGISASVCTSIYLAAFQPHALRFLFFMALVPVTLGGASALFMNHVPYVEASEVVHEDRFCSTGRRFGTFYVIVAVLVVYQMVTALLSSRHALPAESNAWLALGSLALVAAVLVISLSIGRIGSVAAHIHATAAEEAYAIEDPLLAQQHALLWTACSSEADAVATAPSQHTALLAREASLADVDLTADEKEAVLASAMPELTFAESLACVNFWLLWAAIGVGVGCGFAFINNLGQMVESLGGSPDAQDVYLSLLSAMNCTGRGICGFVTERCLHRFGIPRTWFLVAATAALAGVMALTAFASLPLLFVSALAVGFLLGCFYCLMPVLTSELFGLSHFASNHSIMHLAPTVGALLISTGIAGAAYQRKAAEHHDPEGKCFGEDCFRSGFLVMAAIATAITCSSTLLYARTRAVYQLRFAELQRHQALVQ
ncbi:hypothetical protein WJX72_000842 [[Myrmecia] bisecta]|uniref:Nodulin-like domain-containing protein n=1 Tax=[Myrmecia] bisecta TaxID=41462 RepID=A0AAW1Q104_9CHLO